MSSNTQCVSELTLEPAAWSLAAAQDLHELLETRGLRLRGPTVTLGRLVHVVGLVHGPLRQVLGAVLELGLRRARRRCHVPETPGSRTARRHQGAGGVSPIALGIRFDR